MVDRPRRIAGARATQALAALNVQSRMTLEDYVVDLKSDARRHALADVNPARAGIRSRSSDSSEEVTSDDDSSDDSSNSGSEVAAQSNDSDIEFVGESTVTAQSNDSDIEFVGESAVPASDLALPLFGDDGPASDPCSAIVEDNEGDITSDSNSVFALLEEAAEVDLDDPRNSRRRCDSVFSTDSEDDTVFDIDISRPKTVTSVTRMYLAPARMAGAEAAAMRRAKRRRNDDFAPPSAHWTKPEEVPRQRLNVYYRDLSYDPESGLYTSDAGFGDDGESEDADDNDTSVSVVDTDEFGSDKAEFLDDGFVVTAVSDSDDSGSGSHSLDGTRKRRRPSHSSESASDSNSASDSDSASEAHARRYSKRLRLERPDDSNDDQLDANRIFSLPIQQRTVKTLAAFLDKMNLWTDST